MFSLLIRAALPVAFAAIFIAMASPRVPVGSAKPRGSHLLVELFADQHLDQAQESDNGEQE